MKSDIPPLFYKEYHIARNIILNKEGNSFNIGDFKEISSLKIEPDKHEDLFNNIILLYKNNLKSYRLFEEFNVKSCEKIFEISKESDIIEVQFQSSSLINSILNGNNSCFIHRCWHKDEDHKVLILKILNKNLINTQYINDISQVSVIILFRRIDLNLNENCIGKENYLVSILTNANKFASNKILKVLEFLKTIFKEYLTSTTNLDNFKFYEKHNHNIDNIEADDNYFVSEYYNELVQDWDRILDVNELENNLKSKYISRSFNLKNSNEIIKTSPISIDTSKINIEIQEELNSNIKENEKNVIDKQKQNKVTINKVFITNYNGFDKLNALSDLPFSEDEFNSVRAMNYKYFITNFPQYLAFYNEIQNRIKTKYGDSLNYINNKTIIRYAIGFSGNIERAWTFLGDYIVFKEDYIPNKLGFYKNTIKLEPHEELLEIIGTDIYGRIVMLCKSSLFIPNNWDIPVFVDYLYYNLEKAINQMCISIDKIVMINDINNVGSSNFSLSHCKVAIESMNKYYVERLANVYIINKGYFFTFVWSIISGFLPERIKKKIIVVDDSHKKEMKRIMGNELFKKLLFK